ncbi:MmgE/PrpD family protein [Planktomarina temperata]|nr:MmgE/PrpD family protein [Planktomarina temperata]
MTAQNVGAALEKLVAFTSKIEWDDIPQAVKTRAAFVLADDIGAMVAARAEPELIALQNGVAASAGPPEATLFNAMGTRLDRYSAALANGCASDWAELDEGYRRVICHAGIYCLPALLAEAEGENHTTADLLRALVLGYETVARVARCFTFPNLVLHPHGSLAAVGGAAALCALRRLPEDVTIGAISSAATMVLPGPYTHPIKGSLCRNIWPGISAQTAMRAVDWVGHGIKGLPSALHDVYADAFGAAPDAAELGEGLGEAWAISDGYHKVFACCQYGHATIEANLKLAQQADPNEIESIHLVTHEKARIMDNPDPDTTIAGKFSMQHIAATSALNRSGGFEAFSAQVLSDPKVAALRQKVTMSAYDPVPGWPNDRPTRVEWTMKNGRQLTQEVMSARGGPDLPFGPDEIRTKIEGIVAPAYPAMFGILDIILALDTEALNASWRETVAGMTSG